MLDIHRRWRQITAPRDALLLGEVNLRDPGALARYADAGGLDAVFAFPDGRDAVGPAGADRARARAGRGERRHGLGPRQPRRSRAVTRFGGGEDGRRRALTLATLTAGLSVAPLVYQGEELGLEDAVLPRETVQDPLARHTPGAFARDVVRTPMPWAPGPGIGCTTAPSAWMPLGDRADADTAAAQERSSGSPLARHRELLAARRRLADLRRGDAPHWLDLAGPLAGNRRGTCVVAANLGGEAAPLELPPGDWGVAFTTAPSGPPARLEAEHAAILVRGGR